jgi:cell division protein FtsN
VASLLDGVSAVAVVGDDLVATRAVTFGVGRQQAQHRRVFIADLLGEDEPALANGEGPGVSDMIRYGISLARVAHPLSSAPNLHTIEGGAESPLAEDVLASPRWRALSEQVHRAGGLLLLAVPSRVPGMEQLLKQLDGALLVGDVTRPEKDVRVLGEVRTISTMRTPAMASRATAARAKLRRRTLWPVLAGVAGLLLAALSVPQIRQRVQALLPASPPRTAADSALENAPALSSLPPVVARVTSDAAWSAELLFTNSEADALTRAQGLADSLPAATVSDLQTTADSARWYRVIAGAFADSISAENFLAALRSRGSIPESAGSVIHTPFALLVDSASEHALARVRVSAYYGRGLPAYALRDTSGWWRVYVGAFTEGAEAARQRQRLDSLNIQSTLVVRVGSTS